MNPSLSTPEVSGKEVLKGWSGSDIAKGKALHAAQVLQQQFRRGSEPTPQLFRHFRSHRGTINAIAYHPVNSVVISGGADRHIFLWDYDNLNKRALRFDGHQGAVNDVAFNATGDVMISASDDQGVGVWVPLIRGEFQHVKAHSGPVRSIAFNPTQQDYFMSASDDKTVKLWNMDWSKSKRKTSLKSNHFVQSWCSHTNWVRSVRFNKDGNTAITASDDRTVNILDTRMNEEALKLHIGKGSPVYADFNPSASKYFGVATTDEFHIYDARTGKMVQCYQDIHTKEITKFCYHPSGDFAITISEDKTLKILDVIEGRPIFTIFGHKGGLKGIGISPDGILVGTGGEDRSLFIWKPVIIPYTDNELQDVGILPTEKRSERNVSSEDPGTSRNGNKENYESQQE